MIKFKVEDEGTIKELVVSGTISSIAADVAVLIRAIYSKLDKNARDTFKYFIKILVKDNVLFETIEEKEEHIEIKDEKEKKKNRLQLCQEAIEKLEALRAGCDDSSDDEDEEDDE